MNVEIRNATPSDVAEMSTLIAASVRMLSKGYYTDAQIEGALTDVFGIDTQLISDGTYYVATVGETLVGCGGWSKRQTLFGGDQMKGDQDALLNPKTDAARIRAFFVHPDWARRGIGGQILKISEAAASACGFKSLTLGATLPGVPLYRTYGFEERSRLFVNLQNGTDLEVINMYKQIRRC